MAAGLEELYRWLPWPMRPGNPEAERRFEAYRRLFSGLIEGHPSFGWLRGRRSVSVLDVAAGTGIAGAAMASALEGAGFDVWLVAVDCRAGDLRFLPAWLGRAGSRAVYDVVAGDALLLPRLLRGGFDVVLLMGSSFPHFNPWQAARIIAGIHRLQPRHGVFLAEQWDIAGSVILRNAYRHILLEGGQVDEEDGGLISLHTGYDKYRGVFRKAHYRIPGWRYIGSMETHLWYLSCLAVLLWLYYGEVDAAEPAGARYARTVLIAWRPRARATPYSELREPMLLRRGSG